MANIKFSKISLPISDIIKKFHDIYFIWYDVVVVTEPSHVANLGDGNVALVYSVIQPENDDMKINRLILVGRLSEVDAQGADEYEVCMSNNELEQIGIGVKTSFI